MYDDIYGTDGAVYVKTYIHIYIFVTGSQTAEESEPDFQWKCEKNSRYLLDFGKKY